MPNAPGTVLTLKQLRLRYPGSESWTLDGLDLSLKSGDRLALVGPSGCGKSTVARAALQLLPPGSSCEGDLLLMVKIHANSVGLPYAPCGERRWAWCFKTR